MEKNEAFRKQVLSRLYGLAEPSESVKEESKDTEADVSKDEDKTKAEKQETDDSTKSANVKDGSSEKSETEKDSVECGQIKEELKPESVNNNGDGSAAASDSLSSKSTSTHSTPTTTTSHLYSVLMAPLDGHSTYRDHALRFGLDDPETGPRKRMRLDSYGQENVKTEQAKEIREGTATNNSADTNTSVGIDLTKNQKRKQKKKRRKHLLSKLEVQRAKDFIYSSENEQFSVEKMRTMIEDVTEFLDAIWDVYCSEARLKGESVEDEGHKAAAVLKCLNASGEGSWGDLQLLSRAKSVLVLRSKNLAASTIARVETELGYDTDIRNFIVQMLKFWMGEIVTKG